MLSPEGDDGLSMVAQAAQRLRGLQFKLQTVEVLNLIIVDLEHWATTTGRCNVAVHCSLLYCC